MKKFAASLGLVALGTTAVHAVEATALNTMQRTKPWSVAASLRGFYDDNINTSPNEVDSFGVDITPSVDYGFAGEQTSFNLGYQLSAKWYETAPAGESDNWDYTHMFEGDLSHTFSPRTQMSVRNMFAIGQEPDVLRSPDRPIDESDRLEGNNLVNFGTINFDIEATDLLAFNLGYRNSYFNYANDAGDIGIPSTVGLLNRIENVVTLDSRWRTRPETALIVGYQYGQTLYTGDEFIGIGVTSDDRNSRSHTMYGGVQHAFTPTLSGVLKAGAQMYDYYGDPNGDTQWSPYVQANMSYQYRSTTAMNVGFSYSRSAADVAGLVATPGNFVRDTETALFYGTVTHEIIARLIGTAKATVQNSTYNGGGFDEQGYLFFQLGADLAYQFTPHLSAHVGYNYDDNDSDVPGETYNRNRVYLGVTAVY